MGLFNFNSPASWFNLGQDLGNLRSNNESSNTQQLLNNGAELGSSELQHKLKSRAINALIELIEENSKSSIINSNSNSNGHPFLFGDEIEYLLFDINNSKSLNETHFNNEIPSHYRITPACISPTILSSVKQSLNESSNNSMNFTPEVTKFQVESTPATPFSLENLNEVQINMKQRREYLQAKLTHNQHLMTLPLVFTGIKNIQQAIEINELTVNETYNEFIFNHPRYKGLFHNILQRSTEQSTIINSGCSHDLASLIEGLGCCGLQLTIQCKDLSEARYIFDFLAVLSPIMLALTAATPIQNSKLQYNTDTRWNKVSKGFDDRTQDEIKNGIPTRFDVIDNYIGINTNSITGEFSREKLVNSKDNIYYQQFLSSNLIKSNLSEYDSLIEYFSYLFSQRDLLVIDENLITSESNSINNRALLDAYLSFNYQTVRLKLPQLGLTNNINELGWRVEFRPMEVQISDFENAAFINFLVLLVKAVTFYRNNNNENNDNNINDKQQVREFHIPINLLKENLLRSNKVNSFQEEKFHWNNKNQIQELKASQIISILLHWISEYITKSGMKTSQIPLKHLQFIRSFSINKSDSENVEELDLKKHFNNIIEIKQSLFNTTRASWIRNFIINEQQINSTSSNKRKDSILLDNQTLYNLFQALQIEQKKLDEENNLIQDQSDIHYKTSRIINTTTAPISNINNDLHTTTNSITSSSISTELSSTANSLVSEISIEESHHNIPCYYSFNSTYISDHDLDTITSSINTSIVNDENQQRRRSSLPNFSTYSTNY